MHPEMWPRLPRSRAGESIDGGKIRRTGTGELRGLRHLRRGACSASRINGEGHDLTDAYA